MKLTRILATFFALTYFAQAAPQMDDELRIKKTFESDPGFKRVRITGYQPGGKNMQHLLRGEKTTINPDGIISYHTSNRYATSTGEIYNRLSEVKFKQGLMTKVELQSSGIPQMDVETIDENDQAQRYVLTPNSAHTMSEDERRLIEEEETIWGVSRYDISAAKSQAKRNKDRRNAIIAGSAVGGASLIALLVGTIAHFARQKGKPARTTPVE